MMATPVRRTLGAITGTIIGTCALIVLYAASVPIEVQQLVSDGSPFVLQPGDQTAQTFLAHYSGLSQIMIKVEDSIVSPEALGFSLRAKGSGGKISVPLNTMGSRVQFEGGWIAIRFPSREEPRNMLYTFALMNHGTSPLHILVTHRNMYPEGHWNDASGDLVFRARFRPPVASTLLSLGNRLAAGKPGVLRSPWTYFLLLTGLAMSGTFLTVQLRTKDDNAMTEE